MLCLHASADETLLLHVRIAFAKSRATYGAPRVQRELRDDGIRVGTKRVARLMRQDGLVGRAPRRRRVATTDSQHPHPIAPNRLDRQFAVNGVAVNQVWVSDLTYVPTQEGWRYLATVLDLASRRCVGWAMGETLETPLVVRALAMAIAARRPAPGLIHHSDRGSQYASGEYQAVLTRHGWQPWPARQRGVVLTGLRLRAPPVPCFVRSRDCSQYIGLGETRSHHRTP